MGLPKQERLGGGVTNKLQNPAHAPTPSRRIPLRPSTGEIRTPRSGGHGGIADGGSGPATGRSHARGNEVIQAASQPRGMAHPSHEDYGGVMGSNTPRVGSRPRSEFPKQREGEGADLFGREVRKVERLRPRTAPSRSSSRAEEAPVQGEGDEGNAAERPQTSASRVSQTSSIVEEKLVNFQMSFQRKNAAKFHNMQDAFR